MRLKVNHRFADKVDELFENGRLVLDDGFVSREIARALSPLRDRGYLHMGLDRRFGKKLLVLSKDVEKRKRRRKAFGASIFEIGVF